METTHPTPRAQLCRYVTNTRHVFLLVCDDGPAKEAELRQALAGLHAGFADVAANPFYTPQQVGSGVAAACGHEACCCAQGEHAPVCRRRGGKGCAVALPAHSTLAPGPAAHRVAAL